MPKEAGGTHSGKKAMYRNYLFIVAVCLATIALSTLEHTERKKSGSEHMNEKANDRRIRKTQKAIFDAPGELLAEKELEKTP